MNDASFSSNILLHGLMQLRVQQQQKTTVTPPLSFTPLFRKQWARRKRKRNVCTKLLRIDLYWCRHNDSLAVWKERVRLLSRSGHIRTMRISRRDLHVVSLDGQHNEKSEAGTQLVSCYQRSGFSCDNKRRPWPAETYWCSVRHGTNSFLLSHDTFELIQL